MCPKGKSRSRSIQRADQARQTTLAASQNESINLRRANQQAMELEKENHPKKRYCAEGWKGKRVNNTSIKMTFQIEWFNIESATTGKSMKPSTHKRNYVMFTWVSKHSRNSWTRKYGTRCHLAECFLKAISGCRVSEDFRWWRNIAAGRKGRREWKLRAWAESSDGGNEKRDFEADRHKVLCGSCYRRRLCFGKTNFFVEIANLKATESFRRHFLQSPSGKRIKKQN